MAISFVKKTVSVGPTQYHTQDSQAEDPSEAPWSEEATAEEDSDAEQPVAAPVAVKHAPVAAKPSAPKPSAPKLSFIKRGKEAQAVAEKEQAQQEQRSKNNVFRFWIPKDAAGDITFLDGNLVDGILDIPFYHEHQINMNGSWNNHFICTQDEEPCPICEGGSSPSYVGVLTVIDHSEYTSKKDNKVHKDNVKLFVAKRDTIKALQKLAVKRNGLRGCRFDVSRTGDKSPSVGNMFDFTQKYTESQLSAMYKGKDFDKSKPIDYNTYLAGLYTPAAELRKLGFGAMSAPVGAADSGTYEM